MLQINTEQMLDVAGAAYDSVLLNVESDSLAKRWINAIARAVKDFEENAAFMSMRKDGVFVIWSQTSDEVYEVSDRGCECKASRKGQPCRHSAARKLYRNYEAQAAH